MRHIGYVPVNPGPASPYTSSLILKAHTLREMARNLFTFACMIALVVSIPLARQASTFSSPDDTL